MNSKLTISTAGNVVVPAYLALQEKGYSIRREQLSGGSELWHAESETAHFIAEDPVLLLALAAIAETRGPDWKASDEQINQFLHTYG